MNLEILFDKDKVDARYKTGWGFSLFVNGVLFDTGEDGPALIQNLREKNIDVGLIEAIVVSHDHWDHTGGLEAVLRLRKKIKVYFCPDFSQNLKKTVSGLGAELIEAANFTRIKNNIYVTGQIRGFYKRAKVSEQALVVRLEKGLVVAVGCCHAGVVKTIEKVKNIFTGENIHLLAGGFHLMDTEKREIELIAGRLKDLGVRNLGPAHCTGYQARQIFEKVFKDKCLTIQAGKTIAV